MGTVVDSEFVRHHLDPSTDLLCFHKDRVDVFISQLLFEEKKEVVGYLFAVYEEIKDHKSLVSRKTLYIDDICVDEKYRGMKVGTQLYNYAKMIARTNGCYDITLNVWNLNPGAMKFYEKMGLKPLKITMEEII